MPERPRFSRFRRMPGLKRIGEAKLPDTSDEPQPLSLYLPGRVLDRAEELSMAAGYETIQAYCADLLLRAIEGQQSRAEIHAEEVRQSPLKSLDDLASDPSLLAEWSVASRGHEDQSQPISFTASQPIKNSRVLHGTILRHAGLLEDETDGLIPAFRRGEPVDPERIVELIEALTKLENDSRDLKTLDRTLAYALHRLAFEGQILLTDGATALTLGADPVTVDLLRSVQEAVDRILSGEDIRYYR